MNSLGIRMFFNLMYPVSFPWSPSFTKSESFVLKKNYLWTQVSQFNSRQRLMVVISDLKHKSMHTIFFAINEQLCVDHSVGSHLCQGTWPPFHRSQCWSIQYKFLSRFVILSNGLQSSNIASMSQFSLCIGSNDLQLPSI